MAAIGKIRSWGPVLATVIGLALFAFIAEEMFRSIGLIVIFFSVFIAF